MKPTQKTFILVKRIPILTTNTCLFLIKQGKDYNYNFVAVQYHGCVVNNNNNNNNDDDDDDDDDDDGGDDDDDDDDNDYNNNNNNNAALK